MKSPQLLIDMIDRAIQRLSDDKARQFLYAIRAEVTDLAASMKETQKRASRMERRLQQLGRALTSEWDGAEFQDEGSNRPDRVS